MPITITIAGNSAEEVKQLTYDLAYSIFRLPPEKITDAEVSTVEEAGAPVASAEQPADQVAPAPAQTAPASDPQQAEPAGDLFGDEPIPTDVELREIARKIGQTSEGKAAIKKLLGKYGVPNITAVPNEKRVAFKRDLEALAR